MNNCNIVGYKFQLEVFSYLMQEELQNTLLSWFIESSSVSTLSSSFAWFSSSILEMLNPSIVLSVVKPSSGPPNAYSFKNLIVIKQSFHFTCIGLLSSFTVGSNSSSKELKELDGLFLIFFSLFPHLLDFASFLCW